MTDGYVVVKAGMILARRTRGKSRDVIKDAGGFCWTDDLQGAKVFASRSNAGGVAMIVGGAVKRVAGRRIV